MTQTPLQLGTNHNPQIPQKSGEIVERDSKGRFQPGHQKLGGRQEGSLNFRTQWRRLITKIALKNGITEDEVDDQVLMMVWNQIQAGHYGFYKDTIDRIYEPVTSKLELSGQVDSTVTNTDVVSEATRKLSEEFLERFKGTLRDAHKPPTT